jgi:hypothetical protein
MNLRITIEGLNTTSDLGNFVPTASRAQRGEWRLAGLLNAHLGGHGHSFVDERRRLSNVLVVTPPITA